MPPPVRVGHKHVVSQGSVQFFDHERTTHQHTRLGHPHFRVLHDLLSREDGTAPLGDLPDVQRVWLDQADFQGVIIHGNQPFDLGRLTRIHSTKARDVVNDAPEGIDGQRVRSRLEVP